MKTLRQIVLALTLLGAATASAWAVPLLASKVTDPRTAFDDLTIAAANLGYAIVKMQPVDSALTKRGFDDTHVRLFFIGKAEAVREAEEKAPLLLQMLPLRVVMIIRKEEVVLMSDDFDRWRQIFSDSWSVPLLNRWEDDVRTIFLDYENGSKY
jgi:hypothetical protein